MAPRLLSVTAPMAPNKTHLAQLSKRGLAARFVRWVNTANTCTMLPRPTQPLSSKAQASVREADRRHIDQ